MKTTLTSALVLLCTTAAFAVPEGLLVHCSFDEGTLQEFRCEPEGSLKPRTAKSDLETVALVDGVHGKALELKEGSKVKYVFSKPVAAALQELRPPFTIALWMKKSAEMPKHDIWFATFAAQKQPGGFEFFWNWKRAQLRWGDDKTDVLKTPTGLLYLNKFHHVAVVHDGKQITIYIDTLPAAQMSDNGNFKAVPEAKRKQHLPTVGQYSTPFNAYGHVGVIDDFYAFTRALSPEEITALAVGKK